MQSPNAETIEGAADNLKQGGTEYPALSDFIRLSQLKELDGFGPGRLEQLRAAFKMDPSADGLPDDFRLGYMLGVQTARCTLMQSMTLMMAKVKASDVL
jgi:hypothetical protein